MVTLYFLHNLIGDVIKENNTNQHYYLSYTERECALKPVLARSHITSIEDISLADHIMEGSSKHWLVESVDVANSTFNGFTICGKAVTLKEVKWNDK